MEVPTLDGITAATITTRRITSRVLFSGPNDGAPVLFLHGNISSATWWEEVMASLPDGYRGIAPDQRGFGDADPAAKIEAARGLGDLSDDAMALLDYLSLEKAHVVGNSLGGNVVWRLMMDYPQRLLSVTQVAPGSPYGFGSTKDEEGTPCYDDFAGSGAGLINPQFVKLIAAGDRSLDGPFTPRSALRSLVFKPPFVPEREEEIISSLLSTHIGEQDYPGDGVPSTNWPYMAPGKWGPNNALSPKYAGDLNKLVAAPVKTAVLWIRGRDDLVVSDTAASDPGVLGAMGIIPNWPGAEAYPAQPMLKQTRKALGKYALAGGSYQEVVIDGAGHVPYIEKLNEFNKHFHQHIKGGDIYPPDERNKK